MVVKKNQKQRSCTRGSSPYYQLSAELVMVRKALRFGGFPPLGGASLYQLRWVGSLLHRSAIARHEEHKDRHQTSQPPG
jgi:hypothetical protein